MKKVKLFTAYNAPKKEGEKNDLPSKTIPSKSLTVRQIFERYSKGTLDVPRKQEIFMDDDEDDFDAIDLEKFQNMDIHDREIIRAASNHTLKKVEELLQRQSQEKDKTQEVQPNSEQSEEKVKPSEESPKPE